MTTKRHQKARSYMVGLATPRRKVNPLIALWTHLTRKVFCRQMGLPSACITHKYRIVKSRHIYCILSAVIILTFEPTPQSSPHRERCIRKVQIMPVRSISLKARVQRARLRISKFKPVSYPALRLNVMLGRIRFYWHIPAVAGVRIRLLPIRFL